MTEQPWPPRIPMMMAPTRLIYHQKASDFEVGDVVQPTVSVAGEAGLTGEVVEVGQYEVRVHLVRLERTLTFLPHELRKKGA